MVRQASHTPPTTKKDDKVMTRLYEAQLQIEEQILAAKVIYEAKVAVEEQRGSDVSKECHHYSDIMAKSEAA